MRCSTTQVLCKYSAVQSVQFAITLSFIVFLSIRSGCRFVGGRAGQASYYLLQTSKRKLVANSSEVR